MSLSRDSILTAHDTKTVALAVPEWNGEVYLRVLSGTERDAFEATCQPDPSGRKNLLNFRARFAVLVIANEKGERLFTDADVAALGKKAAPVLNRIVEAGFALNALSPAEVDALGKTSEPVQSDASGSGSPKNSA